MVCSAEKMGRVVFNLLAFLTAISLSTAAVAEISATRITSNAYEDNRPHVAGDYLVWQGRVDGDWEVFLYDAKRGESERITDNDADDVSPRTDGEHVVWQGFVENEWEILLWHRGAVEIISQQGSQDLSPLISDGFVVWTSEPFGDEFIGPGEIVSYDLDSQNRIVLSAEVDPTNVFDDTGPGIKEGIVTWLQTDEEGNRVLHAYDLSAGTMAENGGSSSKKGAQAFGDFSVLTRFDGNDREVFLYEKTSRTLEQITNNDVENESPCIGERHVSYTEGEGPSAEIYLATYASDAGNGGGDGGNGDAGGDAGGDGDGGGVGDGGGGSGGGGSCFVASAAFGFSGASSAFTWALAGLLAAGGFMLIRRSQKKKP